MNREVSQLPLRDAVADAIRQSWHYHAPDANVPGPCKTCIAAADAALAVVAEQSERRPSRFPVATEPCVGNCAAAGPVTHVPHCHNRGKWPMDIEPIPETVQALKGVSDESIREAMALIEEQGPCAMCGIEGEYAAHRLIDGEIGMYSAGESLETIVDWFHRPPYSVTEMLSKWIALSVLRAKHDAETAEKGQDDG